MNAREFLTAELDHAARQLARVRRLAAQMESRLAAEGLDDLAVYERLATNKAYRQLQRDEITFHQMWLRVHKQLERQPSEPPPAQTTITPIATKQIPYRKPPTPGRNEPCHCGSNLKYKRCCGNPLLPATRAA